VSAAAVLGAGALEQFVALRERAASDVAERFLCEEPHVYGRLGERGREACREDLAFTLEFLRPALEFGLLQTFVDYAAWLREVLANRGIPHTHVALSLQWIGDFYRDRLPPGDARALRDVLARARRALAADTAPLERIDRRMPAPWDDFLELEEALITGQRAWGSAILRRHLERGHALLDVELHLVQPALYQVGRNWQCNRASVAQEHLATTTASALLAELAAEAEPEPPNGRRGLLACAPRNEHALGLRIVADAFEQKGWRVRHLGANVPPGALTDEVERWRPHLVGLSVSMPYQLASVRDAIAALRTAAAPSPAVMIGGLAINALPAVAALLGAQAEGADAAAALDSAERLVAALG